MFNAASFTGGGGGSGSGTGPITADRLPALRRRYAYIVQSGQGSANYVSAEIYQNFVRAESDTQSSTAIVKFGVQNLALDNSGTVNSLSSVTDQWDGDNQIWDTTDNFINLANANVGETIGVEVVIATGGLVLPPPDSTVEGLLRDSRNITILMRLQYTTPAGVIIRTVALATEVLFQPILDTPSLTATDYMIITGNFVKPRDALSTNARVFLQYIVTAPNIPNARVRLRPESLFIRGDMTYGV